MSAVTPKKRRTRTLTEGRKLAASMKKKGTPDASESSQETK